MFGKRIKEQECKVKIKLEGAEEYTESIRRMKNEAKEERVFKRKEDNDINKNKNVVCVDQEFDDVVRRDMKIMIATAFISLEAGMRRMRCDGNISERSIETIGKKASQMKQEINGFIDSQVNRIIIDSKVREQNDYQALE